jgi:hypothetical protein
MQNQSEVRRLREVAELEVMRGLIGSLTDHVRMLSDDEVPEDDRANSYHKARMYLRIFEMLVEDGLASRVPSSDVPF